MRRLYSWPAWVLRAVIRYGVPSGLVADAWVELATRAAREANEVVRATADDETGPWPTSMPKGLH